MAEPILSPIGRSINAIRRRFSASSFVPNQMGAGANQQVDPELTRIIIRNTNAVNTVTVQLTQVANQVNVLTQTLSVISESLALSSQLEEQRANAETNRQRQLAVLGLREGKESDIEQKIVNAALEPVEVLGRRATNILTALGKYFSTILFGWLSSETLRNISALAAGNKEVWNKYKNTLYTAVGLFGGVTIVGGLIFSYIIGGIKKLINGTGLFFLRNIRKLTISLVNLFRGAAGAMPFRGGIKGVDDIIPQKTKLLKGTKLAPMARVGNFLKSAFTFGAADAVYDTVVKDKNPVGAAVDSSAGAVSGKIVLKTIKPGSFKKNLLRYLLSAAAFFKTKQVVGDKRKELIDGITGNNNQSNASIDKQIGASTDTSSNTSDSDITPPAMSDDNKKSTGFSFAGTADFFTGNLFDFDKQNDLDLVKASTNKKDLNKKNNLSLAEAPPQIINMSSDMGNEMKTPSTSSGTGSMGGSVPRIPANNNSNNYIYNSMREYQISVV